MLIFKRIFMVLVLALTAGAAVAQSEYLARPGDTLVIEVLEDNSLNRSVAVLPDGRFSFPYAGTLPASGLTVGQIQSTITSAIAKNFAATPNVFVSIVPGERIGGGQGSARANGLKVYFLGEFNTPGMAEVAPGTTVLQALAQSGGMTKFAATKRVQLRRTDPKSGRQSVTQINYKALSKGEALSADIRLKDGDIILVPERRLFE